MAISTIRDGVLWDRFVEESPYGLLFHRWRFLQIVEQHTGYRLLPYGVYRGDELIAVFPLFYRKDLFLKSVFSPPPLTCIPYMGFVVGAGYDGLRPRERETWVRTIVDEADAEIRKLSPNFVYVQMAPCFTDIRPFKWNDYREESHFTYLLDLDRPEEELLKSFDRKSARTMIKKAGGFRLTLKQVNDADLFLDIMTQRYAEQGLTFPIVSRQYLKDLLAAFPDHIKMYFLYNGDDVVSLMTDYEYKGLVIDWLGAAKMNSEVPGTDYLKWELMKKARADGYSVYDIQGAGDRRLSHYKSKFNPRLEVCYALSRKDAIGSAAEWAYSNILRRRPALRARENTKMASAEAASVAKVRP